MNEPDGMTPEQMQEILASPAADLLTPEKREYYESYLQGINDVNRKVMGLPPGTRPGPPQGPGPWAPRAVDPALQAKRAEAVAQAGILASRPDALLAKQVLKEQDALTRVGIDPPDHSAPPPSTPPYSTRSRQPRLINNAAKAVANEILLRSGPGGLGEQKSALQDIEAKAKGKRHEVIKKFQEDQTTRKEDFAKQYDQLRDEETYFNLMPGQIKSYKAVLGQLPGKDWSPEERYRLRVRQAEAQRRLDAGKSLHRSGPYRTLLSKFMAAIAVGTGSWAAVRTGRNPALELFQNAIKNDILGQQKEASLRSGRRVKAVNEYDRIKRMHGDDLQATLTLSALHYGKAADEVQAKIETINSKIEKQKLLRLYNELKRQQAAFFEKAQAEHALANQGVSIGVKGMRWVGPPGVKPDIKELREVKDVASDYHKYVRKLDEMKTFTGDYMAPWSQKLARARIVWEDIIALAGKLGQKGVLQEFERTKLEEVVPQPGTVKEAALDQLGAGVDQLRIQVEHDFRGYMEPRTHYKMSEEAFRVGELGRAAE